MSRISNCCNASIWEGMIGDFTCNKCHKSCGIYDEASFKAGQQAGRQEVVDWVKESGHREIRCLEDDGTFSSCGEVFNTQGWIAKLKEWGIG